ncbi:membrane protein insertase YidC [Candidatus Coxiella mudrowiae]|uniref:Membrane protein insertase YidC n=1 Tax=Candidatus Coxiella mudrowiae TaxID=2054173 RepID=A0ABN4HQQ0_9COXI|nr:membrane protein insertase YidC [Candidatus Coxiella mudrowiae]AKQ33144.1 Membrane protein insertase YidC [Candidatus Coxiella mudrowiae]
MTDIKKAILYIIVALLAIALFNAWMSDYPPDLEQKPKSVGTEVNGKTSTDYTPPTFTPGTAEKTRTEVAVASTLNQEKAFGRWLVTVKTDVLELAIDTHGGNIVSAKLPKYPISLEEKQTCFQILSNDTDRFYIAQSGLTNLNGQVPIHYMAQKKQYELADNQNELIVQLRAQTPNGLHISKTYTFHRNDYAVQIGYQVHNGTAKPWEGSLYTQITRREPTAEHRHFYLRSYNGVAISSPQIPYEKVTYEAMDKQNINRTSKDGWIAMQQHYFLSAWIPGNPDFTYHYYSHVIPSGTGPNLYVIGFVSPQMSVASGETATSYATFYVGPEVVKRLKALAPGLDRTIDYGWLWPISTLLFWIMSAIHAVVKNWGWTIVLTTILIKIVFYWFSAKSFRSMARMREMQPRLQALKERYGDDRQALSRATMELYRKEKINPLGGCLPMLIQIPVFIAFYYVIIESVELRQAQFILWIHDLSVKDPYYILPILMGVSMLAQQSLSPTSPDPAQQKVMWILPVIFTVFFINFPVGLVLYWLANNVVQTLQQWYVNKIYESHKAKLKIRRERKKK